jgi:hypothetical protein
MVTAMMNPTMAGMPGTMPSGMTTPMPGAMPSMNYLMVPRCTITMEKGTGGMKITCACEDKMSAGMLQNLCSALAGTMCSCCCMMNGMMVCCCNLMMGMCKCERTKDGVCLTCTSGDKECAAMIQACCESMTAMMHSGCTCCIMMNNMPICCCC